MIQKDFSKSREWQQHVFFRKSNEWFFNNDEQVEIMRKHLSNMERRLGRDDISEDHKIAVKREIARIKEFLQKYEL